VERYFSTGQSPQRAVAPMEEKELSQDVLNFKRSDNIHILKHKGCLNTTDFLIHEGSVIF